MLRLIFIATKLIDVEFTLTSARVRRVAIAALRRVPGISIIPTSSK